jgi:uncharacterized protein
MTPATVCELWRYPIKSMRGEKLDGARIGECGVDGDRTHALRDQETGKIASAKLPRQWGVLLRCAARVTSVAGAVCISLPDGRQVTTGQDDVDAALCMLTNRAVRLVDTVPVTPEIERYWPDVDGLPQRDLVTSNVISQGSPAGTFVDYAPIHLLTTATLAALSALHPSGQVDSRRFRPNLVIETPDAAAGFVENEWVGGTILIGHQVRLRITNPAPRCVVPTLPQDHLVGDINILRAIAAHNRPPVPALDGAWLPCLGVYASVERGGGVRVGDVVRIADRGGPDVRD